MRLVSAFLLALFIFSSCATTTRVRNPVVKPKSYNRVELSGMQGKSIAFIQRIPQPLKAYTYEDMLATTGYVARGLAVGILLGGLGDASFIYSRPKSDYSNLRDLPDPSMELRKLLTQKLTQKYNMVQKEADVFYGDRFYESVMNNQDIEYFIDVKPVQWQLRWFSNNKKKYYYYYKAELALIHYHNGIKILEKMVCEYKSVKAPETRYEVAGNELVFSPEVARFYEVQPAFQDWYQNDSAMLYEHTRKAVDYCMERFQSKISGGLVGGGLEGTRPASRPVLDRFKKLISRQP